MTTVDRRIGILMALVAASLVVGSFIHLAGLTPAGTKPPFNASHAGIAEAVIAVVLGYGAFTVLASARQARLIAPATTGFAIVGFLVGMTMTAQGGDTADVVYHVVTLPVLVATLILLLRPANKDVVRGAGRH
jgi:peptidoglycan/LPS O-acetylase OafA/YrhL